MAGTSVCSMPIRTPAEVDLPSASLGADLFRWEIGDICLRPKTALIGKTDSTNPASSSIVARTIFYNAKSRALAQQTGNATSTDPKPGAGMSNPIVRTAAPSWDGGSPATRASCPMGACSCSTSARCPGQGARPACHRRQSLQMTKADRI